MKISGLVGLLLLFCLVTHAQVERSNRIYFWPEDTLTHKFSFRGTVYIRGVPEKTIHKNAIAFVKNIQKPEGTVPTNNDNISTISCKGMFPVSVAQLGKKGEGVILYTLTIESFDNGFLYTITDIEHTANNSSSVIGGALERSQALSGTLGFPNKYWQEVKEKCYYDVQVVIEQMKEFIDKHSRMQRSL